MPSLVDDLSAAVGREHALAEDGLVAGYCTDWTRRYTGTASCVARPGSPAEVSAVLRCCAEHGAAVVPQGGNTGLVGGGVPARSASRPQVILSTRRLRRLDPVDALSAQVTVGAGITLAELREHAAAAGLEYGVDLAARESATVGGTIATNAGGIRTIRYGTTRAQLLGVEAVLPGGQLLSRLSGLPTDNTGYDLSQLLAGSEGTLAVLTAARLRLWPAEPVAAAVLCGVAGIAGAASLYASIRAHVPGLRAAEYLEAAGLDLVREVTGLPLPFAARHEAYLLAEIAGDPEQAERLAEASLPDDTAVAMDGPGRAALWAYRERHTEAISAAGIPHKLDVALPLARIADFRAELGDVVAKAGAPGSRAIVFGHIGAGNLHVNVLGPDPADETVDEAVLRLAAAHGGTISAEHGIGRAKAGLLTLSRSTGEIAAMRAIKTALDPAGLLNPGVLLGE